MIRSSSARTFVVGVVLGAALLVARPARAWNDATGDLDMPWLGSGARARMFTKTTTCIMCPTGSSFHRSWGTSGYAGTDPYDDVDAALRFLQSKGVLDTWPKAIAEGSFSDGRETIEARAAPYRFTIAMLDPMVIVMRFDLGALVKAVDFDADQAIGTPRLNQAVEFGTHVPATGTLLWFSPTAGQVPTPVRMTDGEHGEILVQGKRLGLERHGEEWLVRAPERADDPSHR